MDEFYRKVRADCEIGSIFNEAVENWPQHLALLKNFWSTVLLTSGAYHGDPLAAHFKLPLRKEHFARWLRLFAETAREVLTPEGSVLVIRKSEQIAGNFQNAIAYKANQPSIG